LLGEKIRVPFGPPTWTTCVATPPSAGFGISAAGFGISTADPVDVCMLAIADEVADMSLDSDAAIIVAVEKPTRAEAITDLEKSILKCVLVVRSKWDGVN
jgi:hypothetical protein